MIQKLKILFIPADNIEANISRSYYFAKGLAKHTDLYYVTWKDYRSIQWLGGKTSRLNTFKCFIFSLLSKFKVYKKIDEEFQRVKCSVFIDAFVGRLIGRVTGKKLMRKHNSCTLNSLINKIKPDVIFYSDASYFFPAKEKIQALQICDIQDDIDWEVFPKKLQIYEKSYKKKQLKKYDLHYIVSENAKKNIAYHLEPFPFNVIFNGADFNEIQRDFSKEITIIKDKYNLQNKFIVTHIGSATWVDPIFTSKLFSEIYSIDQSIILILVGSMAKINLPNVINIGMVPVNESYIYYNLSDLGLLLKNSDGSDFLYNSVPLKNIQYAAAKKPVISFPINWLEKEKFNNTIIINNEDITCWIDKIQEVRKKFSWSEEDDKQWNNYNWDIICSKIYNDINIEISNKESNNF